MKQKNTVEKTTFRKRLYVFVCMSDLKTEFFQNDDVALSDPALISDSQSKDNKNCRKWNAFDLFQTFFSLQLNFASLNVRSFLHIQERRIYQSFYVCNMQIRLQIFVLLTNPAKRTNSTTREH